MSDLGKRIINSQKGCGKNVATVNNEWIGSGDVTYSEINIEEEDSNAVVIVVVVVEMDSAKVADADATVVIISAASCPGKNPILNSKDFPLAMQEDASGEEDPKYRDREFNNPLQVDPLLMQLAA